MLTSSTAAVSQPVKDDSVSSARRAITLPLAASLATLLSVLGIFAVFSTVDYLWALWTTDPLKSIGAFIPLISLILILRVWHSLGWELSTSPSAWWAFALLAFIIALVHIRDHAILELVLTPSWTIFVPPHSFLLRPEPRAVFRRHAPAPRLTFSCPAHGAGQPRSAHVQRLG
jgi:hypothetical protein